MLSLIRDNRQNPGQQNLHLVYRQPLHDHQSVSIDLLEKQGDVDGRFIRRFGLQFSYEWARYMIRAAWDPYVNFTPQNMVRVSVATRF
jgi:hypothetical protein